MVRSFQRLGLALVAVLLLNEPLWAQPGPGPGPVIINQPGGATGTLQYNNAGTFGGYAVGGAFTITGGTTFDLKAPTGDLTGAWPGSVLANIITAGGPVGDATHVPQITYDAKGRLLTVTSVLISGGGGGTGTVTNPANLTIHAPVVGGANGTTDVKTTAAMTNGQLLVGATGADPVPQTPSGDATLSAGGAFTISNNAVTTAKINTAAVTYAKIQNEGAGTLLGNPTGGAGPPVEITLGTNLSFAAGVLNASGGGGGSSAYTTIPNAGSTGTAANKLAKLTGAPSTAIITAITDVGGTIGVVTAGSGTTGNATIQYNGLANCVFDGATTAGDWVQNSPTVAGDCHDAGASPAGQVIGKVLSTNGAGGTYSVALNIAPDVSLAATTCTNQAITAIPANGQPTCSTLTSAYLPADVVYNDVVGQAFTGGIHPTPFDNGTATSGTKTIDCGNGALQKLINGGAFTLAMSANDGSCVVRITNNGSAGAITFSGFSEGSNTGDALVTTNTNKFDASLTRIGGNPHYLISALQ